MTNEPIVFLFLQRWACIASWAAGWSVQRGTCAACGAGGVDSFGGEASFAVLVVSGTLGTSLSLTFSLQNNTEIQYEILFERLVLLRIASTPIEA